MNGSLNRRLFAHATHRDDGVKGVDMNMNTFCTPQIGAQKSEILI